MTKLQFRMHQKLNGRRFFLPAGPALLQKDNLLLQHKTLLLQYVVALQKNVLQRSKLDYKTSNKYFFSLILPGLILDLFFKGDLGWKDHRKKKYIYSWNNKPEIKYNKNQEWHVRTSFKSSDSFALKWFKRIRSEGIIENNNSNKKSQILFWELTRELVVYVKQFFNGLEVKKKSHDYLFLNLPHLLL